MVADASRLFDVERRALAVGPVNTICTGVPPGCSLSSVTPWRSIVKPIWVGSPARKMGVASSEMTTHPRPTSIPTPPAAPL